MSSNSGKTALLLGATGLVGSALLPILLADPRYAQVNCLVRRPLPSVVSIGAEDKLQPVVIDFEQMQDYEGYFAVDHVYVCLGTTIKQAGSRSAFRKVDFEYVHVAAQLARAQRVKSFVWVSSVGANAKSGNFYLRVKGELENAIFAMSGLEQATAVRPSLLLGERHHTRPAEQLAIWGSHLLSPLLLGPLKKYRPIAASEVARQMVGMQAF